MTQVCRFKFKKRLGKDRIEEQVAIAILSAESTFGEAKVRLYARYAASEDKAVVDVSGRVGQHVAESLIRLITKKYGEDSFSVERIRTKEAS